MSHPNRDQIGKIEQELERAEQEFRRAAEAKSFDGMMRMHFRMLQLVAHLSAAWSGSAPTVFTRHYRPPGQPTAQLPAGQRAAEAAEAAAAAAAAPEGQKTEAPAARGTEADTPVSSAAAPKSPQEEKAPQGAGEEAAKDAAKDAAKEAESGAGTSADDDIPDIEELEKQLAELASRMQKCLAAGDMDGMLKANEGMGALSELMTRAEAKQKEKKKSSSASSAGKSTDPLSKITEVSGGAQKGAAKTQAGSWSAGDTMALAKQRAEERRKQQRLTDSFESVVGELDKSGENPVAKPKDSAPGSTVDLLFNERTKAKLRDSQEHKTAQAPAKPPMTQEQLRDKLDAYTFYQILSVPSTASFEELHKSFFKKIRKLNQKLANKSMEMWQFQEFVNSLCLAHDVLKYPNARLQYDLIIFGTDGEANAESAAKAKLMPLKELLKFSTLINPRELADALEKHKTNKDERDVAYYLVEKGLISTDELDSILFAQKLVSAGKLTVAQFELAMQEMRENSIPLLDTLVASEWIQPQDVFSGEFL